MGTSSLFPEDSLCPSHRSPALAQVSLDRPKRKSATCARGPPSSRLGRQAQQPGPVQHLEAGDPLREVDGVHQGGENSWELRRVKAHRSSCPRPCGEYSRPGERPRPPRPAGSARGPSSQTPTAPSTSLSPPGNTGRQVSRVTVAVKPSEGQVQVLDEGGRGVGVGVREGPLPIWPFRHEHTSQQATGAGTWRRGPCSPRRRSRLPPPPLAAEVPPEALGSLGGGEPRDGHGGRTPQDGLEDPPGREPQEGQQRGLGEHFSAQQTGQEDRRQQLLARPRSDPRSHPEAQCQLLGAVEDEQQLFGLGHHLGDETPKPGRPADTSSQRLCGWAQATPTVDAESVPTWWGENSFPAHSDISLWARVVFPTPAAPWRTTVLGGRPGGLLGRNRQ